MKRRVLDAVARQATAVSRRGSLQTLIAAAFACLLATPKAARAGKAGKLAKKRCKRQEGACAEAVRVNCQSETCLNALLPCCALLATCNAGEATRCFLSG